VIGHLLGDLWIVLVLGGVPLQSLATRRTLELYRPGRLQIYVSTLITLAVLALVTWGVDATTGRQGLSVLYAPLARPRLLAWTAATLGACVLLWFGFLYVQKLRHQPADMTMVSVLPRTTVDHIVFVGVSLVAGGVEEYVYRGFSLAFLATSTGSRTLAVLLVTVGFGLAHVYQGRAATLKTAALGAVLAVPVLVTGSLVPSILAHAALDILLGYTMRPLLRRWNLLQYGEWTGGEDDGKGL